MKKLTMALPILLAFNANAETEMKGSPEELRAFLHPAEKVISISHSAEEITYKDTALIHLSVTTNNKKLATSLKKNNEIRAEITKRLTEKGIKLDNIKNAKFSTSPDYGWFGDKPDSFKVSNTVTIKITDEAGLENVAGIVDSFDEVSLINTTYEHSLKDEYLQKVKEKALDKVLQQQEFYANKLNIELQAVSFSDNRAHVVENVNMAPVRMMKSSLMMAEDSVSQKPAAETSFEKLTYHATVTVNFKVKTPDN